jgi:hypothetical protein
MEVGFMMTRDIPGAIRRVRLAMRVTLVEAGSIFTIKAWMVVHPFVPYLFRKDLGIPDSAKLEGIDKFASFMASLSTPLLVALAAIAPLALLFGAGLLMFGNKKAGAVLAGTVGALALAACATGLVS